MRKEKDDRKFTDRICAQRMADNGLRQRFSPDIFVCEAFPGNLSEGNRSAVYPVCAGCCGEGAGRQRVRIPDFRMVAKRRTRFRQTCRGHFFLSMLITNDIALMMVVTVTVSLDTERKDILVILEAMAANSGLALTPVGNPQNLLSTGFTAFSQMCSSERWRRFRIFFWSG
jgi:hypothetical protein